MLLYGRNETSESVRSDTLGGKTEHRSFMGTGAELRRWYNHDPNKWAAFQTRYERGLATPAAEAILDNLVQRARQGTVTLVYAWHAGGIGNAAVLPRLIRERIAPA